MPDILLKIDGDDAAEVLKNLEKLFKRTFGSELVFPGVSASTGVLNTLAATTLAISIPVMLAKPQGIFQKLGSPGQQDAFIRLLQNLRKNYNVDFTITTPDGKKMNLASMDMDELRELLQNYS